MTEAMTPDDLLAAAAQERSLATTLERSASQHVKLASLVPDEGAELLRDAAAMRAKAAQHLATAQKFEVEYAATRTRNTPAVHIGQATESINGPSPSDAMSLLRAGVAGAAVLLPGGVTVGAAAIAAAPYLGIDPSGQAHHRVRTRAMLRRDSSGKYRLQLQENVHGRVSIAQLLWSDAQDDRGRLQVGDELTMIDGVSLRPQMEGNAAGIGTSAATSPSASSTEAPHGSISLDAAKDLVRAAGETMLLEVAREEVRPALDRLLETKSALEADAQKLYRFVSPQLNAARPHIERAGQLVHQVHDDLGAWLGEGARSTAAFAKQTSAGGLRPLGEGWLVSLSFRIREGDANAPVACRLHVMSEREAAALVPQDSPLVDGGTAPTAPLAGLAQPHAPGDVVVGEPVSVARLAAQKDALEDRLQAAVDEDDFDEATRLQDEINALGARIEGMLGRAATQPSFPAVD